LAQHHPILCSLAPALHVARGALHSRGQQQQAWAQGKYLEAIKLGKNGKEAAEK
jgi:hypothetical protein